MIFPRTSSFDYPVLRKAIEKGRLTEAGRPDPRQRKLRAAKKQDGPSRADLEHWYRVIDEMMDVGSHQSSTELRDILGDIRDDIYAFLH